MPNSHKPVDCASPETPLDSLHTTLTSPYPASHSQIPSFRLTAHSLYIMPNSLGTVGTLHLFPASTLIRHSGSCSRPRPKYLGGTAHADPRGRLSHTARLQRNRSRGYISGKPPLSESADGWQVAYPYVIGALA